MKRITVLLFVAIMVFCSCNNFKDDCNKTELSTTNLESSHYNIIPTISEDNILSINGNIKGRDEIQEFSYDINGAISDSCTNGISDFFKSFNNKEIEEIYYQGWSLIMQFSTDNIKMDYDVQHLPTTIDVSMGDKNEKHTYFETGYSTFTFLEAYRSIFTDDMIESLFEYYPAFIDYNDEIWAIGATYSANGFIVHKEFNLICETNEKISFNVINYQMNDSTYSEKREYYPEKKENYTKEVFEFELINVNGKWLFSKCPYKWI